MIDKSNATLPGSMRRMRSYEVRTPHAGASPRPRVVFMVLFLKNAYACTALSNHGGHGSPFHSSSVVCKKAVMATQQGLLPLSAFASFAYALLAAPCLSIIQQCLTAFLWRLN